jgi:hypothetical protein
VLSIVGFYDFVIFDLWLIKKHRKGGGLMPQPESLQRFICRKMGEGQKNRRYNLLTGSSTTQIYTRWSTTLKLPLGVLPQLLGVLPK